MINLFQPSLGNKELALIKDELASNWIGKRLSSVLFNYDQN
jgi:hypothetical protein